MESSVNFLIISPIHKSDMTEMTMPDKRCVNGRHAIVVLV